MAIFIPLPMVGLKGHDHNLLMPFGALQAMPQAATRENHPTR